MSAATSPIQPGTTVTFDLAIQNENSAGCPASSFEPFISALPDGLQVSSGIPSTPPLAPGATAEGVKAAAAERGETVVVVGHQPDCSQIVAALTGGPEPAFAPCAMLAIDL